MGNRGETFDAPVLVVEADPASAALVERVVERVGRTAIMADRGDTALARLNGARPALALIEVELPGMNGLELLRELHEHYGEDMPVILLSGARTSSLDRSAGLLLGADDYVAKPFDPDELAARIRRSLRRAPREARDWTDTAGTAPLTARELEVLALLAAGRTQKEIAAELVISPKTASAHIQNLMAKLGVHSRAQAVAEAYRRRLVSVDVEANGLAPVS